jgi:hypothetical protein
MPLIPRIVALPPVEIGSHACGYSDITVNTEIHRIAQIVEHNRTFSGGIPRTPLSMRVGRHLWRRLRPMPAEWCPKSSICLRRPCAFVAQIIDDLASCDIRPAPANAGSTGASPHRLSPAYRLCFTGGRLSHKATVRIDN